MMDTTLMTLVDEFAVPRTSWMPVVESAEESIVDGVAILARIAGPFFLVNESSRNRRFYQRDLWERVIHEHADRMSRRDVYGTIGHDQPLDDAAIRDGKISHLVTRLWIEEHHPEFGKPVGMGEVLILNTPSGRNLNTVYRARAALPVSSRGFGSYAGMHGNDQIVDPGTYQWETFDFVRVPGVMLAMPHLLESDPSTITMSAQSQREYIFMPDQNHPLQSGGGEYGLLAAVTQEKVELQTRLNEALVVLRAAETQHLLDDRTITDLKSAVTHQTEATTAATQKIEEMRPYNALGTPETIGKMLLGVRQLHEKLAPFGGIVGVEKMLGEIAKYREIGSIGEYTASAKMLESYGKYGVPEKIKQGIGLLQEYMKMGTVQQIKRALTMTEQWLDQHDRDELSAMVTTLTKAPYSINEMEVRRLFKRGYKLNEAITFIRKIRGTTPASLAPRTPAHDVGARFRLPENASRTQKTQPAVAPAHEAYTGGSRTNRLFATHGALSSGPIPAQ